MKAAASKNIFQKLQMWELGRPLGWQHVNSTRPRRTIVVGNWSVTSLMASQGVMIDETPLMENS